MAMYALCHSSGETSYPDDGISPVAEVFSRVTHSSNPGLYVGEQGRQEPSASVETALLLLHEQPSAWPILICLLGDFRLLHDGQRIMMRSGGKMEALLCYLGLHYGSPIPRTTLVNALWPTSDPALGGQSLNSLIYQLHKLVGNGHEQNGLEKLSTGGAPLVVHDDGRYRLNVEAGIGVDTACFEKLAKMGEQHARSGDWSAAMATYAHAVEIYRGDLCAATDVQAILVRERLRSLYLTILARIADHHFAAGDYGQCLSVAWRLLDEDPCREDAHRVMMRCYVKRGERAAALRHYHTCEQILRAEIDAEPEGATKALVEQIRLQPDLV